MHKNLLKVAGVLAAGLSLTACIKGNSLPSELETLEALFEDYKIPGLRCEAERQVALAEANLDFADYEIRRGELAPALRHLRVARENLEETVDIVGDRPECYGVYDRDGDGIFDSEDNCPDTPNTDQADMDGDGIGDVCDDDRDGDGVLNQVDNCPDIPNSDQGDIDRDGIGDVCDDDRDGDGVRNDFDNCPDIPNLDQADRDGDGIGDVCDDDRDGDGIKNDADNCPDVPNPDQQDTDGDGIGDACSDDRDGDGIKDNVDNCPDVPNTDQRDTDGDGVGDACDDDIDGDGIPNAVDQCPYEPEDFDGDRDEDGCPDEEVLVVVTQERIEIKEQIQFENNRAVITGERSFMILRQVGAILRDNPDIKIRIEGHTDSVGSDSYNLRLSDNRAKAVREWLEGFGIAPSRMTSVGRGEAEPIDTNSTAQGRQNNRRVEFDIVEQ